MLEAVEISAGRVTASDPFKRLPIRPVIYWNVGKLEEEAAAPAAAKPAAAPASAGLDVNVEAAVATGSSIVSPGFKELVQTPAETPRELDAEVWRSGEAERRSGGAEERGRY